PRLARRDGLVHPQRRYSPLRREARVQRGFHRHQYATLFFSPQCRAGLSLTRGLFSAFLPLVQVAGVGEVDDALASLRDLDEGSSSEDTSDEAFTRRYLPPANASAAFVSFFLSLCVSPSVVCDTPGILATRRCTMLRSPRPGGGEA